MKKWIVFGFLLCFLLAGVFVGSKTTQAASAVVELSAKEQQVSLGNDFTVVCTVISSDPFSDVQLDIEYNAAVMEFVKGGKKVSGGDGVIHIVSKGNEDEVTKRTYSLRFRSLAAGIGAVKVGDAVSVTDLDGKAFSISSNQLIETIIDPMAANTNLATATPEPTPVEVLSTNNKLKVLRIHCISMKPEFDPEVLEYTVQVDCDTNLLYFNYIAAQKNAVVKMKNNDELLVGENDVRIVVTAESGDKRTYKLNVVKESEDQTRVREQQEKGNTNIDFSVYEKQGAIYIQNQYQFQIVDVPDDSVIPSGYVKTTVNIEGKNVPAYTMEKDLENNYLLMYLKGDGTEPALYQYDRMERTIQRYTGTMTQKVNKGGNVAQDKEIIPREGAWLYVTLIGMAVMILILLIVILNMVLRRKLGRGRRELDDMDF